MTPKQFHSNKEKINKLRELEDRFNLVNVCMIDNKKKMAVEFNGCSINVDPQSIFKALNYECDLLSKEILQIKNDLDASEVNIITMVEAEKIMAEIDDTQSTVHRLKDLTDSIDDPGFSIFALRGGNVSNGVTQTPIDKSVYRQALNAQVTILSNKIYSLNHKLNSL